MVSETAMSSIEAMIAAGLHPTPRDIIRLNAIGLRLEAANARRVQDSTHLLPRVAQVSPDLWFRQPTIGHEIWIEKVERLLDPDDYMSSMAVRAFALSRDIADLPDADSPRAVDKAVRAFAKSCAHLTREQILEALRYAVIGCDPSACEHPAVRKSGDGDGDEAPLDWGECVAVGVLNEGRAVLWGISEADMRRMTTRQLSDVIERAKIYHKMRTDSESDVLQGQYFATVDEITARLTAEGKTANG